MNEHQKTTQAVLSDRPVFVANQKVEKTAIYMNVNGTFVNIIDLMAALSDRVTALEEA